jgi:hypothetical protein
MIEKKGKYSWVMIHWAPVLTLWAAVVAEMPGFEYDEALTLGRLRQTGSGRYSENGRLKRSQKIEAHPNQNV